MGGRTLRFLPRTCPTGAQRDDIHDASFRGEVAEDFTCSLTRQSLYRLTIVCILKFAAKEATLKRLASGSNRYVCLALKTLPPFAMTQSPVSEDKVYTFVLDQIETVPHLEALLLLWNSRPQPWTVENLAKRLYVSTEIVDALLDDLVRRGLIVCVEGAPDGYRYESSSIAQDQLLSTLDLTYRRETVRISTMIHSKPSSSVREFARAFRFTKERK